MSLAAHSRRAKAVLFAEKPLTMTSAEARQLVETAKSKNLPNAVQHNLRYYPLVQQIRQMIAHGDLGEIPDCPKELTHRTGCSMTQTGTWRVDSKENGRLRAMGDIGSHWMDMVQHLTGQPIVELCADLNTFHKTRKRPKGSVETFSGKKLQPTDYEEVPIDTDDFGAVLFHLANGARGSFTVSQMSAGCKNRFAFDIFGSKAGASWNQEQPDTLWIGHRNEPNQIIIKDGSLLYPGAAAFAD